MAGRPAGPRLIKARELRAKFPETPTLALARILYKKNPLVYKDVEEARQRFESNLKS